MLPLGSILIFLIVAPKGVVFLTWKQTLPSKTWFIDTDTNILMMCVDLLLIV